MNFKSTCNKINASQNVDIDMQTIFSIKFLTIINFLKRFNQPFKKWEVMRVWR